MKKFKKILLYDFSENSDYIKKLYNFTEEIQLITATDDYQNLLTQRDFVGIDCFVVNVFDNFRNELFENSELKVIFTMFTDNSMFDINFLRENKIYLQNITGQAAQGVCEYATSVLLNQIKKTVESQKFSKSGRTGFMNFKGTEIFGKKVGIIGYGSLGRHFHKIMEGFGADVKYFSKSSQTSNIEEIFTNSDIIFVSCPLTEEKFSLNLLNTCKEKVFILNPSRVELFDISDLYDYLKNNGNSIFWQDESMTEEWSNWKDKFLELDNFILTPHCGFFTEENPARVEILTLQNIEEYQIQR